MSTSSWLDYIVFDRWILFNSIHHNAESAKEEPLGFAVPCYPDFHVALHLAPKEDNPDPEGMHITHRAIDELHTARYPVSFMKFNDFTKLFLLTAVPIKAMVSRLNGMDPYVGALGLPPPKYSKKYWVAFRIIE